MEKLEFQNVTQYFLEICNVCEGSHPDSPWSLKTSYAIFSSNWQQLCMINEWYDKYHDKVVAIDRKHIFGRKPFVINIHKRMNDCDKK